MQHVVLTLGSAGAALANLEREAAGSGGGGSDAEPEAGRCTVRITHMPVRTSGFRLRIV